jgi:glyoxylase-like metal-dependent hydrolase (beta-lactamase superfamily II)
MMVPPIQTLQLDDATVSIINVGDFHAPLWDEWLQLAPEAWAQLDPSGPIGPVRLPILCFHIALPGYSLLIDASAYPVVAPHRFAIPDYQPPPGLLASLADAGIDRRTIDHVVITHTHFDHFNGLTTVEHGTLVPCFPRARHLLGQADWEAAQTALAEPANVASHTLGVVARAGLLDLVAGDRPLANGIQILATPGETLGHQCVRIQRNEHTLYFLGDLYHHPAEVAHPEWCPHESEAGELMRSRLRLAEVALEERALLFGAHIPSVGRLARTPDGVCWEVVRTLGDPLLYTPRVSIGGTGAAGG